ncbi:MAG: tellurite resistance TerB family protein [Elioraea sp.]|nr:tellurite resistance TerB family protein [Elioraea sp.]
MIDAKSLLDRFLGAGTAERAAGALGAAHERLAQAGVPGGLAGAAAGAGLIALLLGGKAGKVARYGGAAALGALAYRAWQNWQQQKAATAPPALSAEGFAPERLTAADGQPFALALIRTMIAAAKADGHIDSEESRRIVEAIDKSGLGAEEKAFLFRAMGEPADAAALARLAATREQAAELWLAARLAAVPDHPAERAFLDQLADRLGLEPDLRDALEREARGAA